MKLMSGDPGRLNTGILMSLYKTSIWIAVALWVMLLTHVIEVFYFILEAKGGIIAY